ncbi:lipocalin-like domain-containing protein [Chloroflexota bacterium]
MKKKDFTGTWKLVSSEFRLPDGQAFYPYGRDAVGMLMYSDSGYMSVQIMRRERLLFTSGDRLTGTAEEIKSAFEGYAAYFGTYRVNQKEGTVTHQVEGSLFPNWAGINQERFFELSDGQLTLRTPEVILGGQQMTGILQWKRTG